MLNGCASIIVVVPAVERLLPHLQLLPQVFDVVVALLLVHVTDVHGHLVLALLRVDLHVLQPQVVVADLVHEVAAVGGHADPHVGRSEQGRRGRGRRRQVEDGVSLDLLMEVLLLLLALVLHLLHLVLKLLVGLLLRLPLGLLEDGLLHDHPHHVLVVEVLLAELQRPEDLLPLGRHVLSVERPVVQVERNRCVFLEGQHLRLMLLFLLLPAEEVLDPSEEALPFFLLPRSLQIFLLDLLVLLQRGTVGKDLDAHELGLPHIPKQKGNASLGVLEHVERISEGTVALLEAVVYLHLKGKGQCFQVVDAEEFGLVLPVYVNLQEADEVGVSQLALRVSRVEGNDG